MYRLLYQDGETPQSYSFASGEVTIGRSPDCQIVLKDFGISRTHAKVVADDDGVRICDLKSKNGTQVNGVPVVEAPLKEGDRILLGKFQLTFTKAVEGKVVLDESKEMLGEEAGTMIRSVGELSRLFSAEGLVPPGQVAQPGKAAPPVAPADQEVEKSKRMLRVLSRMAEALIGGRPLTDVLQQVMDLVFEQIPVDRGLLMLHEDHVKTISAESLVCKVMKHRRGTGTDTGKITISKGMANRVIKDKVGILTSDAQFDSRFNAGDSIRFHGIRSAMAVPLCTRENVIGIIHVDTPELTNRFTITDLELLTALATFAAVAIERARADEEAALKEKKVERLGRFLSPQVTKRILASANSQSSALVAPEVKEVTVLFADVVGFTSMSEKLSPAAVALILNDYLSRMTEVIFKYEGTLDKYIGDAIMAVFGAPLDMPDHAAQCIRAALEMRERLEEFNSERKEGPVIRIRIGINTGNAVAGEIGSINKKEYTVLGDAVNTASRLESSVAKPGLIVIGQNTHEQVKGMFELRPMGVFTLKGKEQGVAAFEVVSQNRKEPGTSPGTTSSPQEA